MFSFRLALTLTLFISYASYSNENAPISAQEFIQETRKVDPETGQISIRRGTEEPIKPLTYEESIIPNSWIVELKEQPLFSYKQVARKQLQSSMAQGLSAKKQLKSMLASHQHKIAKQQRDFIQYAKRHNIIDSASKRLSGISNAIVVSASKEDVEALKQIPEVTSVHPNRRYQPTLAQSVPTIKADQVWERQDNNGTNVTGKGIKIAILDTGIDYTHPDLGGCFGEDCKVAGGYDVYNDDGDPIDDDNFYPFIGHGTYVAAIVASKGIFNGVAPDATLYAYKVCGDELCSTANILRGLELAVDPDQNPNTNDAVDVINLSLGSQFGAPDAIIPTTINEIVDSGIIVVVPAGNNGSFGAIGDVASAEKAITVAATNQHGNGITSFSSRGPVRSVGYLKPDISTPGENISTICNSFGNSASHQQRKSDGTTICSNNGTSMSAPHISGIAALLLQAKPELAPDKVKSAILNNATSISEESSASQGAGMANALAAINSDIYIAPSIAFFGNYDPNEESLDKTLSLTLENESKEQKSLSINIFDLNIKGVKYTLLDQPNIQIAAGTKETIQIRLEVDSETYNAIKNTAFTLDSKLEVVDGNKTYRVPLVFSKMSELSLDFNGAIPTELSLINHTGDFIKDDVVTQDFYLPTGMYSAIGYYGQGNNHTLSFINAIDVANQNTAALLFPEQPNQIRVTDIIDGDGESINLDNIKASIDFEVRHNQAKYLKRISVLEQPYGTVINLPDIDKSMGFEFRIAGTYQPNVEKGSNEYFAYNLWDKFSSLGESKEYELNQSLMLKQSFLIDYKLILKEGVKATLWPRYGAKIPGFTENLSSGGWGSGFVDENGYVLYANDPFTVSVFSTPREENNSYDLGTLKLRLISETQKSGAGFPYFSFNSEGLVDFWRTSGNDNEEINLLLAQSKPTTIPIDGSGLIASLNPRLLNNGQLALTSNSTLNYPKGFHSSIFSRFFAPFGEDALPYEVYCKGNLTDSGTVAALNRFIFFKENCDSPQIDIRYNSYLRGTTLHSIASMTFSKPGEQIPFLRNILTIDQGAIRNNIVNKNAKVIAQIAHDSPINVKIEYKDIGTWKELDIANDGQDYISNIKTPNKAKVTHLRVSAVDSKGNSFVNTLNSALILGKDQSTVFTDDFDEDGEPDYKDMDDDNDGIEDLEDDFVLDASESLDTDSDGIGNNADADDDNDNVEDSVDAFPLDANESLDTDSDGIGNNADTDDDNDNVEDSVDAFPLDANESLDTDSDGIGNNADTDDDNDNVEDSADAFPLNKDESVDTDSDGTGNNADTDDDGDGVSDAQDAFPLDSSRSARPTQPSVGNGDSSGGGGGSLYWLILLGLMSILAKGRVIPQTIKTI